MNRRYFFQKLASGLLAAAAPSLFLPKLIKPQWKAPAKSWVRFIDPAAPGQDGMVMMAISYKITPVGVVDMQVTRVAPMVSRWRVKAATADFAQKVARWTDKPVILPQNPCPPAEALNVMNSLEETLKCDIAIGFEKT